MSKNNNATCAICGTPYEVCRTCQGITSFKPWRTITDTMECYKIYMTIHQYTTKTIDKDTAKKLLSGYTLPKTFQSNIQNTIDKIMHEEKVVDETAVISSEVVSTEEIDISEATTIVKPTELLPVEKITYQKGKSNFKYKKKK